VQGSFTRARFRAAWFRMTKWSFELRRCMMTRGEFPWRLGGFNGCRDPSLAARFRAASFRMTRQRNGTFFDDPIWGRVCVENSAIVAAGTRGRYNHPTSRKPGETWGTPSGRRFGENSLWRLGALRGCRGPSLAARFRAASFGMTRSRSGCCSGMECIGPSLGVLRFAENSAASG
jgi:hypothetical protein